MLSEKVFSIKDTFNFSVLLPYEEVCDYYLFDTKGKLPGGNGYTFNWNVLKDYPSTKPFFLSGGIGLKEVEKLKDFIDSLASKYCYSLDVNSKFEINPGVKNINDLEKFSNSKGESISPIILMVFLSSFAFRFPADMETFPDCTEFIMS